MQSIQTSVKFHNFEEFFQRSQQIFPNLSMKKVEKKNCGKVNLHSIIRSTTEKSELEIGRSYFCYQYWLCWFCLYSVLFVQMPSLFVQLTEFTNHYFVLFNSLCSQSKSLKSLEIFGFLNTEGIDVLKKELPRININKSLFSSIARPVGSLYFGRIWDIQCKD